VTIDKDIWIRALNNKPDKFGVIKNIDTDFGLNNLKMMLVNGYVLNFITCLDSWNYTSVKDDPSDSLDDSYEGSSVCYWVDGKLGPHAMTIVGYNDSIWVDINNTACG
jgi:C1A family cysteine protease